MERLRQSWVEVREQICKVYQNALKSGAGDCSQEMLSIVKPRVLELCLKDPHQLFQRLETGVRDIVVDIKLKLIELLQKQAKNPSLAQDFIQSKLQSTVFLTFLHEQGLYNLLHITLQVALVVYKAGIFAFRMDFVSFSSFSFFSLGHLTFLPSAWKA